MRFAAARVKGSAAMEHYYTCEQCGSGANLCVSDWGYVAALCDECLKERRSYSKLPAVERDEGAPVELTPTAT
jgi:hypothetical protein